VRLIVTVLAAAWERVDDDDAGASERHSIRAGIPQERGGATTLGASSGGMPSSRWKDADTKIDPSAEADAEAVLMRRYNEE
jgi:hypothetical protein